MQLGKVLLLVAGLPALGLSSGFAQVQLYNFTTIAGTAGAFGSTNGLSNVALFNNPTHVVADTSGNIYVADYGNSTIREVIPVLGQWLVTTISGTAGTTGSNDGIGLSALFNNPLGIAISASGTLYVADYGNSTIREVAPGAGSWVTTTIAGTAGTTGSGDGLGIAALFNKPAGVAVDSAGNVYVADSGNNTIREVVPVSGTWVVITIAGKAGTAGSVDGTNTTARFNNPAGVAVDSAGNVYVTDFGNSTIRRLTPTGTNWVVTTIAGKAGAAGSADGTNTTARFNEPMELALDAEGNLDVADSGLSTIRKLTLLGTNWVATTIAGTAGVTGSANGTGSAARFNHPFGVTTDTSGNVYVADTDNNTIRQGRPNAGAVLTVLANPPTGGTVSGAGAYLVGTTVKLSAHANSGWTFTGWSDGGALTHTITVPATNITATANFAQQIVAAPTITPAGGTFSNSAAVTLKCATAGATIRYTINGANPTSTSPAYKNTAITLTISVTLNAQAFKAPLAASAVVSAAFLITPPPPLTITTTSLSNGVAKVAYSATLVATGGVQPYKWALAAGKLPTGLTLNATKGIIAGKPTKTTTAPASFKVQVTDFRKQTHQQSLTLTIN